MAEASFIFLMILVAWAGYWILHEPRNLVRNWAEKNHWEIISADKRALMGMGPFAWTTRMGQSVYYVTLKDRDGRVQRCWVRFGGFFAGQASNNVDIHWDASPDDRGTTRD